MLSRILFNVCASIGINLEYEPAGNAFGVSVPSTGGGQKVSESAFRCLSLSTSNRSISHLNHAQQTPETRGVNGKSSITIFDLHHKLIIFSPRLVNHPLHYPEMANYNATFRRKYVIFIGTTFDVETIFMQPFIRFGFARDILPTFSYASSTRVEASTTVMQSKTALNISANLDPMSRFH